jgi:hypothetical protein
VERFILPSSEVDLPTIKVTQIKPLWIHQIQKMPQVPKTQSSKGSCLHYRSSEPQSLPQYYPTLDINFSAKYTEQFLNTLYQTVSIIFINQFSIRKTYR